MESRPLRLALLLAALAAVAVSAYSPHWRPGEERYPYPVHLDEYVHWVEAREKQLPPTEASFADVRMHERGFHAYLAALQATTDLEWVVLFEAAPVAVSLLIALAIYLLGEAWRAGAEAALLFAALPTTLRFLGPGFLVPIMPALLLALAALWLVVHAERARNAVAVAVLLAALWTIHAMGALLATILVSLFVLFASPRSAAPVLLGAAAALLTGAPYILGQLAAESQSGLPTSLAQLRLSGIWLHAAAAVGAAALVLHPDKRARAAGAALGLTLAGLLSVMIARNVSGVDPLRIYDRAVTSAGPILAVLAGSALALLASSVGRLVRPARARRPVMAVATLVLLGAASAYVHDAWQRAEGEVYYRILEPARYEEYRAAAALVDPQGGLALVDGLDTLAWHGITGMRTYHVLGPEGAQMPEAAENFLGAGGGDTAFLVRNHITVVVTARDIENGDLRRVSPSVYLLRADYAERLAGSGT